MAGVLWLSLLSVSALDPIHLEDRPTRPKAFVDSRGREFIFHGTNAIVKGPPWYPDHTTFSRDISMAKEDFEWMQKMGLNLLRLGVMWPGVEPVRGQYNDSYLDEIDKIVTLAASHGVYTLLDMHQDGLSEFFCGQGLPDWAVKLNENHRYNLLTKKFPAPFDTFENDTCYYNEAMHNNATFPTREACRNHNLGPGWYEVSMESSQAYQALWDNWNGIGDAFAAMWAKIALRFKGRSEVLGLDLINEPFVGDVYHNPFLFLPWPSPTNADTWNMQPTYDKVCKAVRAVDEDVLIFFSGFTFGDLGAGFTAAPGGKEFSNRSVLAYHYYEPPQININFHLMTYSGKSWRLGTAAMLTETERPNGNCWNACGGKGGYCSACDSAQGARGLCCRITKGEHFAEDPSVCKSIPVRRFKRANQHICIIPEGRDEGTIPKFNEDSFSKKGGVADGADAYLQGWATFEWKSFFRENPDKDDVTQYGIWGADKTGVGDEWHEDRPGDDVVNWLARTYAPTVTGSHVKMHFDVDSDTFELQYDVGTIDSQLATEIFVLPSRYPEGAEVLASSSVGSVHVDYDGKGQWVRIFAGNGLQVGARVVVHISKKTSRNRVRQEL